MRVLVIDGQGGNIGRQLVKSIRESFPGTYIRCVGTNSVATANMLKGGADEAATGENAVVVGCDSANIIVGPIGIIVANALLGEVTEKMATAISSCCATKVLIPTNKCDIIVAGVGEKNISMLLEDVMNQIRVVMKKS